MHFLQHIVPWLLCGAQTPLLKWGKATQVTQDTWPHGDAQPTKIFLSSVSSGIEKNMMTFFSFIERLLSAELQGVFS